VGYDFPDSHPSILSGEMPIFLAASGTSMPEVSLAHSKISRLISAKGDLLIGIDIS
jgi:hypothetical protein